jgi:predicted glutamine amidotransferase
MCGLVGIGGRLAYKDEAIIKKLLWFDYLRGNDSTGMAAIAENGDASIAKAVGGPWNLFDSKRFETILQGAKSKVFLGHNRASTRGKTTEYNAHPFQYGHIIGAHNGTLTQDSWNLLEGALEEKFNVDSQALIAAIAKFGIEEAMSLCTTGRDPSTGAWSLTWYDQNEGSLNFLRNKHRPMWYSYSKDFQRIIWASEYWMIESAMRTSGTDLELYKQGEKGYQFFATEEDTHYKFDLGLLIQGAGKPKPKVQVIKGKEPPPVSTTTQGSFPTRPHTSGCSTGTTRSTTHGKTTTSLGKTPRTPDSVIHWLGSEISPLAGVVDDERFNELNKYGCNWCEKPVGFSERGLTIYERDDVLLCSDCSGNDPTSSDSVSRIYLTADNFTALRTS